MSLNMSKPLYQHEFIRFLLIIFTKSERIIPLPFFFETSHSNQFIRFANNHAENLGKFLPENKLVFYKISPIFCKK